MKQIKQINLYNLNLNSYFFLICVCTYVTLHSSNEASTMNCKNLHFFASKGQGFTASPPFHVVIQGQRKFTWWQPNSVAFHPTFRQAIWAFCKICNHKKPFLKFSLTYTKSLRSVNNAMHIYEWYWISIMFLFLRSFLKQELSFTEFDMMAKVDPYLYFWVYK